MPPLYGRARELVDRYKDKGSSLDDQKTLTGTLLSGRINAGLDWLIGDALKNTRGISQLTLQGVIEGKESECSPYNAFVSRSLNNKWSQHREALNKMFPDLKSSYEGYSHKIWLGESFLLREDVKNNLRQSSQELPQSPDKRLLWVDKDYQSESEEYKFAQEHGYTLINIKTLENSFFEHEGFNFKTYVLPEIEELAPNYGLRSDILRLLILKRDNGLYSDIDEAVEEEVLLGAKVE